MIGCAVCGRPVSRHYDNGLTCEINRLCTDGTYNACSMLYGACCRVAKEMGYWAYVMLYDKEHIPKGHKLRKMARWVNMRSVLATVPRFEDYLNGR